MLGVTLMIIVGRLWVTGWCFRTLVEVVVARRTVNTEGGRFAFLECAHHAKPRFMRLVQNIEISNEAVKNQPLYSIKEPSNGGLVKICHFGDFVGIVGSDEYGSLASARIAKFIKTLWQIRFDNCREFYATMSEARWRLAGVYEAEFHRYHDAKVPVCYRRHFAPLFNRDEIIQSVYLDRYPSTLCQPKSFFRSFSALFCGIGTTSSRIEREAISREARTRYSRLLFDRRPLLPCEETIDNADDQQAQRNQVRIEGFIFGATIFCASFLLGMESTDRVEGRRLRGDKSPKWDSWLWLERLSCLGLFVGGFLMFVWPR